MSRKNLKSGQTKRTKQLVAKLSEHDKALDALASAPQSLSGAGAINLTARTTMFTSTGSSQALTLAAGNIGQRKTVIHHVDGGSGVLTNGANVTLGGGINTITFNNVRDWVELEWSGSAWNVVAYGGVAFT